MTPIGFIFFISFFIMFLLKETIIEFKSKMYISVDVLDVPPQFVCLSPGLSSSQSSLLSRPYLLSN